MNYTRFNTLWFGILLIIFGAAMLMDRLGVINIDFANLFWPLMMIVGLMIVGKGFASDKRGKIYWGTVLFMYSLFFLMRSIDTFELHGYIFFPASFLIFGIAFFMMYLTNLKDWPLLIPAVVLCFIGSMFILTEYGFLYKWEVWDIVRLWWPIILIMFGLAMLLRRKCNSSPSTPQP
mgnify:FL=1